MTTAEVGDRGASRGLQEGLQRASFILERIGKSSCPSTLSDLAFALSRFTCAPQPPPYVRYSSRIVRLSLDGQGRLC